MGRDPNLQYSLVSEWCYRFHGRVYMNVVAAARPIADVQSVRLRDIVAADVASKRAMHAVDCMYMF